MNPLITLKWHSRTAHHQPNEACFGLLFLCNVRDARPSGIRKQGPCKQTVDIAPSSEAPTKFPLEGMAIFHPSDRSPACERRLEKNLRIFVTFASDDAGQLHSGLWGKSTIRGKSNFRRG
ncbi:hypothetical protein CDAR_534441 [Caerostris darwini]|uniref:Uncharacterized protein n=1 Tax=Caerostris darwini TaxID=1538125 RepID=A0AAV4QC43_9ARAC|nr:hypothetical protein CDAR_534441 [Caerostris darwini]